MYAVESSETFCGAQEKRRRAGDILLPLVVDAEVARGRNPWQNSDLTARWNTALAPVAEGVGTAMSARIADERNPVLGQT